MEPMASRLSGVDMQALRQFVGQSPWAVEEVQRQLALKVVDLISSPEVWILDDTSFPKPVCIRWGWADSTAGPWAKWPIVR